MVGALAALLVTATFAGVFPTAAAAATTTSISLSLTSGTFGAHGNTPNPLPAETTPAFTAMENEKTGDFKGATLTIPPQPESNTGTKETILIYENHPASATGTITHTGVLTISDTVLFELKLTAPLTQTCVTSSPTHLLFQSTSPYDPNTGDVALADTSFNIPKFTGITGGPSCTLASSELNTRFSGNIGNVLTLSLHGSLTVPPPPVVTTTNLAVSPSGSSLAGTTVVLAAKVSGPNVTSPTTGPGGTMEFFSGSTLLGTKSVTSATTTFTTSTLLAGNMTLTAVYSGGDGFAGSTSIAVPYTLIPTPSVSLSLPPTLTGGNGTPAPFSLTITNPPVGESYKHVYLMIQLAGIRNLTHTTLTLQYQSVGGTWCTLAHFRGTTTNIHGYFLGAGSCTPNLTAPGAAFALTKGSSLSANLRIAYPRGGYYGTQVVTATLSSGTCKIVHTTTATTTIFSCTNTTPLTGSIAPVGSGMIEVVPATPLATTITDTATRPATLTVRKTFDVSLQEDVAPVSSGFGLPAPTGTVSYSVDGVHFATVTFAVHLADESQTQRSLYDTTTLAPGKHMVTSSYSGNQVYQASTLVETFTVIDAPIGTKFACIVGGEGAGTVSAYVTATGIVPVATLANTTVAAKVKNVSVTLDVDPAVDAIFINTNQSVASLGFLSEGTNITPGAPTHFTGTTRMKPDLIGTWTTIATTTTPSNPKTTSPLTTVIPIKKGTAPGTVVAVGASSVFFVAGFSDWTCAPATASVPAPIGATTVAGAILDVSPTSPVVAGTPVTLTTAVEPIPANPAPESQVTFFDGTTSVGMAPVTNSGPTAGKASVTVTTPGIGGHTFRALWSGTSTVMVPPNTSNSVSYTVSPAIPLVTTEPQSETVNAGQVASFHASASGIPGPTIQWQLSNDGGGMWSTVAGAISPVLTVTAVGTDTGNQYRALFVNSGGTVISSAATLTVEVDGYRLATSNGSVYAYGDATFFGSMGGQPLGAPIVGTAETPGDGGYWLAGSDGGIFSFGDATFLGSMGGKPLNKPIVGIASTPDGQGYWLVGSDGGIFAFGNAQFYGSMGGKVLNKPIVAIASTPDGKGYWEVASDGGIFAFGDATFYGSTGSVTLDKPIVGMAATPGGQGYWLVAADGGVFSFGAGASFFGTVAGTTTEPIVGLTPTTDGGGYWETAADGEVFQFGDAALAGTAVTQTLGSATVVAMSQ